ncbi:hypothetical protein [Haliscomenobacter hydrossis]|uniref:Uncharacterized protein n=1 Tax=Haliscomenobacter hydrossis (strain ATCC 27775 / DSM 1100 / LMG 10767 / O) TaxID=760192 RepID=F4L3H2_HALH1|nr:hypothetical protein [Haliscomenobacter hydrossis]AEE52949.1 hypothetical protein Halhy_5123 [Haliscomenobacter hydrossis DSM 1100]
MKEYKMAKGWAIFIYLSVPLLFGLFCMPFITLMIPAWREEPSFYWFAIPISLIMMALCIAGLIDTMIGKVWIDDASIHAKSVFFSRSILLTEIKGFRIDDKYIYVEPKTKAQKRIKIQKYYGKIDELVEWLNERYPNLDETDAAQEYQEILNDNSFGYSQTERETAFQRAKKITSILNWTGGVIAAWVIFWPVPYPFAILSAIALPLIALVVLKRANGLIHFDEKNNSAHPSIIVAFLIPALGLMLRALFDFHLYDHTKVWLPVLLLGLAFTTVIFMNNKEFELKRGRSLFMAICILIFSSAYAYGALICVNCYYDQSNGAVFRTQIVDKNKSGGNTTSYYFEVTPWGTRTAVEEVEVSRQLYDQLQKGDEVRVLLFKGKFDIPWYVVVR